MNIILFWNFEGVHKNKKDYEDHIEASTVSEAIKIFDTDIRFKIRTLKSVFVEPSDAYEAVKIFETKEVLINELIEALELFTMQRFSLDDLRKQYPHDKTLLNIDKARNVINKARGVS